METSSRTPDGMKWYLRSVSLCTA